MKNNFEKKGFTVIKKAISKEIANFLYKYFLLKRNVAKTLFDKRYISPISQDWGTWSDQQVPKTYSHYGDVAMDTLLTEVKPKMEEAIGLKLYPAYTYARIYKKGDILHRHKDRFSCEISVTMNLGGDNWSIYLEPSGEVGKKGIKVDLKPGDMLVYSGCELEHWRNKFKGKECIQVFLHYNNRKTPGAKDNMFDKRLHLGLPSWFKK